jgi:hypothetical protein
VALPSPATALGAWLQSLGAEHVVLYSEQDVVAEVEKITCESEGGRGLILRILQSQHNHHVCFWFNYNL